MDPDHERADACSGTGAAFYATNNKFLPLQAFQLYPFRRHRPDRLGVGQREYLDTMISRVSAAFPGALCTRCYNPTGQTRIRTAGRARTPFGH